MMELLKSILRAKINTSFCTNIISHSEIFTLDKRNPLGFVTKDKTLQPCVWLHCISFYYLTGKKNPWKKSMKCDVVFACPHGHSVNQATLQQQCSHFNIKPWYHLSSFVKYVLSKQDWKVKLLHELKNKTFLRKLLFPFQNLTSSILHLWGWHYKFIRFYRKFVDCTI